MQESAQSITLEIYEDETQTKKDWVNAQIAT